MTFNTSFPQRPRRGGDWWSVWQNLQDFANRVFDTFANKFVQGTATVLAGNTTGAVVATIPTPYNVTLSPTANPGTTFWVSGKTGAGFTVNIGAVQGGNVTFDWVAKQT